MSARWQALHPEHGADSLAFVRGLFLRAPAVLAVVSTAAEHPKIPVWEQQLSAGAVCMNLEHAANALGYASSWITDWYSYDPDALERALIAFRDAHGFQCGFCTPGFLITTVALLEENPEPSEHEIREALSGNICRCTGYGSIVAGVQLAAERGKEVGA